MFGTVLLTVVTVMHVYVFGRAWSLPFLKNRVSGKHVLAACAGLWLVFFLGRVLGHGGTGTFAAILETLGMNWMAMVFLAAVSLLAIDVVTGFGFVLRRHAPMLRGLALAAAGMLSVAALVQGLRPPVVQRHEVSLPGLPADMDGAVLVALSDLHLGPQTRERWLEAVVARVGEQEPDIIVLLGDVFEGHGPPPEKLLSVMKGLSAPLGVWAIPGNHDGHGPQPEGESYLDRAGARMLRNTWAEVRPGLVLAGVDDGRRGPAEGLLAGVTAGRPEGALVVLSHRPGQAERAAELGAGLMLSGHTHGGQIWPFGHVVKLRYPLLSGRYETGGMTVIVSRGAGTWGPRMRLWHPGEVLRLTLRTAPGARQKRQPV